MDIPSGLDHIKLIGEMGERNRKTTALKLSPYQTELNILGISLSILYQVSTCHRKCFGGPHILEGLCGRVYNLACSAYFLTCRGMYDEALNLVRSIGEISNLIVMSTENKEALKKWINSDKKTRLREFTPAKIRKILEKNNSPLYYARKDWYSKLCEDYTHVNPSTKPNIHNINNQPFTGGVVQDDGLGLAIKEISTVCTITAMIASQFANLDDMFEELSNAVSLVKKESEKNKK